MHPDEDARHPWLPGEAEFLRQALSAEVPLLGVCLGAQLIARAAGAWVGPAATPEVGWRTVELTPAGRADPVLGALPSPVEAFQWHFYTYRVPAGGVELAVSTACTQAFAIGRHAWGIQFHAEVTRSMIETWVAEEVAELPMAPAELLAATASRIDAWNGAGRALCSAFLAAATA
jgi:GMP synthase (glutamine-hydrolysing)